MAACGQAGSVALAPALRVPRQPRSGMSGPCMACTGEGDEASAAVIRFIKYGRPRREEGRGVLGCAKARPTRPKINNGAARIVRLKQGYILALVESKYVCGVQSCSKGHC